MQPFARFDHILARRETVFLSNGGQPSVDSSSALVLGSRLRESGPEAGKRRLPGQLLWETLLTTLLDASPPSPSVASPSASRERVLIAPHAGWIPLNLRELWQFRELLYFLALRDIKVRYKQTALGAAWAILQPFLTMVVFTIFFGGLAGISTDEIPKPLFYFAGLLPWLLFATSLTQSSNAIVSNERLISKTYFPRLIVPLSSVLSGLVDFAVAFCVLLAMMAFYHYPPSWAILALPLFVLLAVLTALSVGLWFSALNVEYRDVRYTIPFLVQFWMFAAPVTYPASLVTEWAARHQSPWASFLYFLNPMVGVVEGCRWALFGRGHAPDIMLLVSIAVTFLLFLGGLFYFRRMEKTFADLV